MTINEHGEAIFARPSDDAPDPRTSQVTVQWLKAPKPGIYLVGTYNLGPFRTAEAARSQLIRYHRESALSPLTTPKGLPHG